MAEAHQKAVRIYRNTFKLSAGAESFVLSMVQSLLPTLLVVIQEAGEVFHYGVEIFTGLKSKKYIKR